MDLERIKRVGIAAAYRGGEIIRSRVGKTHDIGKKGAIDLVTEADTGSEKAVIEEIQKVFPDHGVLAEESGESGSVSDHQWIIDPLDGTTNFAHGIPIFCVSIAYAHSGDLQVGVVFNPVSGELFTGVKGSGAQLNNRPIGVSKTKAISESLLVTGFPYNFKEIFDQVNTRFGNCLKASRGVRRLGSAALDLCYLACGRFEGFWEQNLNPWDTAAGVIISQEAGAKITDFSGKPFRLEKKELLATNGNIHEEMLALLAL